MSISINSTANPSLPASVHGATVADRLARTLASRIISGAYAPGEKLPQDQIALEFGVSHVPVREAFRRLEAQGLAVSVPRRGLRVAAMDRAAVLEVSAMRAALECLALRRSMKLLTPDDLAAACKALNGADASPDLVAWEDANHAFHSALYAPCSMPRLLAAIDDLQKASSRYLQAAWREMGWKKQSDKEHHQLLRAVTQKDVEKALGLLGTHILAAAEAVACRLEKN